MAELRNKIMVPESCELKRLDAFLSSEFKEYSRTYIQKLIKNGFVAVNSKFIRIPKTSVSGGDCITVSWPNEVNKIELTAEEFKFDILFEDNNLLVIDKPPGVVVHPAAGNREGTVVNALLGRDEAFAEKLAVDSSDVTAALRPGIVHRLDKDTSGCLVIAKNIICKNRMSALFSERKVKKTYYALTYGVPEKDKGMIENLIGRHPVNRKKMAVVERKNGKKAVTVYEVIKKGCIDNIPTALLKVNILTGRTHQIRVHLASLKSPVLGDSTYGGNQKISVSRQMLHAGELTFSHPFTGKTLNIVSSFPEDFQKILTRL
ncbi:MAG: RluA family pseudouridine synthase [Victivallales bacterium]|nr:RluA family pseudouridine synthase [Victivallales bacterium]MCF7888601.1 RluA family pseudouridine synthase [Victivallales bacterium]